MIRRFLIIFIRAALIPNIVGINMISIVVIEYHSLEEIKKIRESFHDEERMEYELIVSSNSMYSKRKQEEILTEYPNTIWTFNERNGGFAYGMNEGLKVAKGDFLIVMNPDVKLKSSLEPMVNYLQKHQKVGIVAPKIMDDEGVIQDSFRHFITPWGFFLRQLGWIKDKGKLHVKDFNEPIKGDWVIGAFMMCRRDFYVHVGGLSDDYFMYCEDMDWCKRAHLAGYDVAYFPETVIEYKGTRSARKSWKYAKIHIKSLLTYWRKYGIWG